MKRNKVFSIFGLLLTLFLLIAAANPVMAQSDQPLTVYTPYPSRIIGFGEVATVPLKLKAGQAQTVDLAVKDLPEGWTASFQGGSQIVDAVYVDGVNESAVDLHLQPPEDVKAGKYTLTVTAAGSSEKAQLTLRFTIQEKLPPRLSLTVDGLPTKRAEPSATATFTANLKNEGSDDLLVELSATQPDNIQVTIESSGQEVNEVQLAANETRSLTIKADPLVPLDAGEYPFTVQAVAGDVQAELQLTSEVVGEGSLTVSAPDGKLSADAYAGRDNPLKVTLVNNGTASLRGVELTSSEPSGWSVTFDQQQIAEIPAGQSVQVSAHVKPAEKAIAGDYMVSVSAKPLDTKLETAQFRVTVRTSTLWGIAGIILIALAVGVVGIAVSRFGRR